MFVLFYFSESRQNKTKVECKYIFFRVSFYIYLVRIKPKWNVNNGVYSVYLPPNSQNKTKVECKLQILSSQLIVFIIVRIKPKWNVNFIAPFLPFFSMGQNKTKVECKFPATSVSPSPMMCQNKTKVECKLFLENKTNLNGMIVRIKPKWNVNLP